MSGVIDFLMKTKNADGTFDVLHPITKTANVKTSEEIKVMLSNSVGSFKNNDTIAAGTSIDAIVRKLVQVQIPPSYTAPTVGLSVSSGDAAGKYEAGTSINHTLKATFTKNDAGALTALVIKKDNVEIKSSTTSPAEYTETFTIGDSTVEFIATATYGDGAIKQDNFGVDYPSTSIKGSSKSSSSIKYTTYRKYFWASDNGTTVPSNSSQIRGLKNSSTSSAVKGTTKLEFTMEAGHTRAVFAYPKSVGALDHIEYINVDNNVTGLFEQKDSSGKLIEVSVDGATAGQNSIQYYVYAFIVDQPLQSAANFRVVF